MSFIERWSFLGCENFEEQQNGNGNGNSNSNGNGSNAEAQSRRTACARSSALGSEPPTKSMERFLCGLTAFEEAPLARLFIKGLCSSAAVQFCGFAPLR